MSSFSGLVTEGALFSIGPEEIGREVISIFSVPMFVNSDAVDFVILGEVTSADMEKLDCVSAWVPNDVMVCTLEEVFF